MVVVMDTTLPCASTITKWLVPADSAVASRPRGAARSPGSGAAPARNPLERVGVLRIAKQVAFLDGLAVGSREHHAHFVGRRKRRSLAEKRRQARGYLEARRRGANCRLKQLLPPQPAELRVRRVQHRDRAGHAGGATAAHRLDERQGLAVLVEEHVGLRACGRALATLERAQLAAPGIVVEEEGAAADAGALRLDEPEHRLHRYRGVDRLASPGEDL